jgi:hypothetical protein
LIPQRYFNRGPALLFRDQILGFIQAGKRMAEDFPLFAPIILVDDLVAC